MKNKKIYIEALRIISAIMVLYIHSSVFHCWEPAGLSDLKRIFYMIPAVVVQSAVPLFMMISGSLLLKKDESLEEIAKKRILKVVITILFVTFIYLIQSIIYHCEISLKNFVLDFLDLSGRKNIVFWFLYWWLSFVILLPFLQKLIKRFSDIDFKYLLFLCLIFSILVPAVNVLLKHFCSFQIAFSSSFSLFILGSGIFYPFLGYYVDNNVKIEDIKISKIALIFIIAICVTISIVLNFLSKDINDNITPCTIFTPVITASLFIFFKKLFINSKNEKINNIIYFFGQQTLGIYLLQVFIPKIIPETIKAILSPYFNVYIIKLILFTFNFFFLAFITAILRKLPIINKIL